MRFFSICFVLFLLLTNSLFAQITKQELDLVFNSAHLAYDEELLARDISFRFNFQIEGMDDFWWQQDTLYASFVEMEENEKKFYYIYFFGGLARMQGMSVEGAALVLCHEIGHGLAGTPKKNSGTSTEGQSDYFSTLSCIERLLPHLPTSSFSISKEEEKFCEKRSDLSLSDCHRIIGAIKSYQKMLEWNLDEELSIFKKAPETAKITDPDDYYYPSQQCRLDTLMAGFLRDKRPGCWYVE